MKDEINRELGSVAEAAAEGFALLFGGGGRRGHRPEAESVSESVEARTHSVVEVHISTPCVVRLFIGGGESNEKRANK